MRHLDAETKKNSLHRAEVLKVIRMLPVHCMKKKGPNQQSNGVMTTKPGEIVYGN